MARRLHCKGLRQKNVEGSRKQEKEVSQMGKRSGSFVCPHLTLMAYLASFLYQTIWRCQKEEGRNKAFQEHGPHLQGRTTELRVRRVGKAGWVSTKGQVLGPDSLS